MKDLFGNEITLPEDNSSAPKGKRKAEMQHAALIALHGKTENKKCKHCSHLLLISYSKTYFKCSKASVSGSENTDWRCNWQACGLFKPIEKNN